MRPGPKPLVSEMTHPHSYNAGVGFATRALQPGNHLHAWGFWLNPEVAVRKRIPTTLSGRFHLGTYRGFLTLNRVNPPKRLMRLC